jgi:hypothetical protein
MTEVPFGEEWADQRVEQSGRPPAERSAGRPAGQPVDQPVDEEMWTDPADRPWTPIPRQAHALERSLIPGQRRLKKTSRSA